MAPPAARSRSALWRRRAAGPPCSSLRGAWRRPRRSARASASSCAASCPAWARPSPSSSATAVTTPWRLSRGECLRSRSPPSSAPSPPGCRRGNGTAPHASPTASLCSRWQRWRGCMVSWRRPRRAGRCAWRSSLWTSRPWRRCCSSWGGSPPSPPPLQLWGRQRLGLRCGVCPGVGQLVFLPRAGQSRGGQRRRTTTLRPRGEFNADSSYSRHHSRKQLVVE
mmetsp:Transcript_21309/g.67415  ORF Transcript_21309/g.67415 Transcript_21309/m.67415 type:complete len:223 (-) Transcript_21309:865-1533(-)